MSVENIQFGGQSGKADAVNPFNVQVLRAVNVDPTVQFLRPRRLDTVVQSGTNFQRVSATAGGRIVGSSKRWKTRVGGDVLFIDTDGWRLETDTTGYDIVQPPAPTIEYVHRHEGVTQAGFPITISYNPFWKAFATCLDTSGSANPSDLTNWSFDNGGAGWTTIGTWTLGGGYAKCTAGSGGSATLQSVASTKTLKRFTNFAIVGLYVDAGSISTFDNGTPYITLRMEHPSLPNGAYEWTFDGDMYFPLDSQNPLVIGYSLTGNLSGSGNLVVKITTNVAYLTFDGVIWWSESAYGISTAPVAGGRWYSYEVNMEPYGGAVTDRTPYSIVFVELQDFWQDAAGFLLRCPTLPEKGWALTAKGNIEAVAEVVGSDRVGDLQVPIRNYRFGTKLAGDLAGIKLEATAKRMTFYCAGDVTPVAVSYDFGNEPVVVYVATELKQYGDWVVESVASNEFAVEADYRSHWVHIRLSSSGQGTRTVRLYRADSGGWHLVKEEQYGQGTVRISMSDYGTELAEPVAIPTLPLPAGDCTWWNGRLVVASDKVYISSLYNPFCFGDAPADDAAPYTVQVPGKIIGVSTDQSALLVWTNSGVWSISGSTPANTVMAPISTLVPISDRSMFHDIVVTAHGVRTVAGDDLFVGDFSTDPTPVWAGSGWLAVAEGSSVFIRTQRWGWIEWQVGGTVRDLDSWGDVLLAATSTGLLELGEGQYRVTSCTLETGRKALVPPHRRKYLLCWRPIDSSTCEVDVITELGEKTVSFPAGGGRVEVALPGSQLPRWIAYRVRAGGDVYLVADVALDIEGGVPRAY